MENTHGHTRQRVAGRIENQRGHASRCRRSARRWEARPVMNGAGRGGADLDFDFGRLGGAGERADIDGA